MGLADMRAEHAEPLDPILIPGIHGTQGEIDFVRGVITGIIRGQAGYGGPIELVGSRADGYWVSPKWFNTVCSELQPSERQQWLNFLNAKAKELKYAKAQLPLLVDCLPQNAPAILESLLEQEDPGSDFDILLKTKVRPSGVAVAYGDEATGQVLDVFVEGEM